MLSPIDLLGFTAGTICTLSFLPQAVRIYKNKSAQDISLLTFIALCIGICLWIVYGTLAKDLAILSANSATLVLGISIIVMKLKYDSKR